MGRDSSLGGAHRPVGDGIPGQKGQGLPWARSVGTRRRAAASERGPDGSQEGRELSRGSGGAARAMQVSRELAGGQAGRELPQGLWGFWQSYAGELETGGDPGRQGAGDRWGSRQQKEVPGALGELAELHRRAGEGGRSTGQEAAPEALEELAELCR